MDLSGFNTSNGFSGNLNAPTATRAAAPAKAKSSGILSRLVGGVTQAPSYFLHADIINPARELAASVSGNKTAMQNAQKAQQQTLGNSPGQAFKRLAGNTAQLATTAIAPEAKAGILAKVAQGAKVGAVAGGGSALANDQNVLKGAGEGALTGGIAEPVASTILTKLLPKGSIPNATGKSTNLTRRVAADLRNHLQQAEASAGGFNAGAKLPGAAPEGISLAKSQQLTTLADKYGIPAGSPVSRIGAIQSKLSDAVQHMHNAISDNNVPITPADRQQIVDEFNSRVAGEPNASELQNAAHDVTTHFKNGGETPVSVGGQQLSSADAAKLGIKTAKGSSVNDLHGLNSYRQKLDSAINFSRSQATPNPIKEQAYNLLRGTISDHIGNMAPDVSAANKTYSELKALEAPTLQENNKLANTGGSLYNRLLNNNVTKGVESKVASTGRKLLTNVGNGTAAESLPNATSQLDKNVVGNVTRAGNQVVDRGTHVAIIGKDGAETNMSHQDFNNLGQNNTSPAVNSQPGNAPSGTPPSTQPPVGEVTPSSPAIQSGGTSKPASSLAAAYGTRIATSAAAGATSNGPQQPQAGTPAGLGTSGNASPTGAETSLPGFSSGATGNQASSASTANDPFSEDSIKSAILQDIQATGGKNVSALTSLYNTFGKQSAKQSTTEQNSVDSLHSALATLSAYNDQMNAAGGGQGGLVGGLKEKTGNIPLIGNIGNASATHAVGAQSVDVATSIAKALTGGKPSSAQIKSWEKSIPLPTDTEAVAKAKMNNITESIQAKLQSLGAQ